MIVVAGYVLIFLSQRLEILLNMFQGGRAIRLLSPHVYGATRAR